MYCIKCGNELKEGQVGNVCDDCQAQEQLKQTLYNNNAHKVNYRMYGFGKALASTIMSVIGYIFALMAYILAVAILSTNGIDNVEGSPIIIVVWTMMALPLVIISIIFGIKSIKNFKYCKSKNLPKPIATLVLGITGVTFSGFSVIFLLLSMLFIALL